jgi:hypothetical protein
MPLQNTSVDPLAELSDDDIDKMLGLETSKLTPKLSSVDSRLIKLDYTDEGDEEFFRLLGESSGVKPKSDIGDMVKEVGTESAKAIPRVLGAVAGQIALAPGAGIRSAIELLPQISTDPSGPLFKSGDVSNAARIFEEIMSVPGKLIATEEQAKAVENLGYAAKPIQMAGEGWRLIGEQANEGLKSLGFADTYIEPLLATYGEAAAIFGLPGLVKRINSSNTWRQFSVKERGLVVQSLTDAVKNNPNMTEGELIRKYDSIDKQWFKESAAKRTVGERPTIKTEQKGVPKTEPPKTVPPNSRPSHEFVSKKGNRYVKVGDNWYSSEGKLMTNRFVIGAAERGATVYGETEVTPTEPEVIAPQVEQEPDDSKSIIDKHFGEPTEVLTKAVKDRSEIERTKTTEEIVEPAESPKVAEAKGFTTAKGSTYTVNEDGTTTRNKAARQEHPGEEGIQPKSKKTWYVTWEDTNKLSEVQALGGAKTTINELPDGRIGVKYLSGKDKGEFERRTVVTYKSSPEIGLMPVEYFGDNKTIHFGNKIVKLVRVGEDKFEDAKDRIEEAVTTPLQGGEVKVEPETKPTKQPKTKKLTANSISRFYKSQGYSSKEALDLAKFDLEAGLPDMYARETGTPVTIENYGDMIEHWRTYTEEQALAAEPAEQVGEVETLTVDQSPFRVKDKEVILQQLRNTPDYRKIDDIDILTNKLAMEVNAAIEGISGDIGPARKLIEALSDQLNVWVTGNELPGGIFSELSLAELSHYADVFREMKKWVGQADKREVKEPGIKLFSIGGAIADSVRQIFNKLTFRKTALQPRPPAPFSIKELARESIRERRSKLDIATYETNRFINSIERKTTPEQQEVLTFMLEKTDIPDEFNRPDLQRVLKSDKEKLEPIAREIKEWFDEGWKNIKRHIPDLSVKQIENYVTHLWDIPKHKRAEATAWFSTQNQFLERRFIPTYEEGIKRGYKPKTINVLEIIKVHDSVTNRAIANAEYIDALLKLKADGIHLVQRSTEAPLDFVEVNYPMLTRRIPLSKGQAKKKKEFVKETRVRVHPELVRPLKVIFEQRFDHPILGAYEAINGLMKKSILSLSLFHHGALGETGVALTGIPSTANIYFNPVKIYKALVRDEFDIFTKVDIARDSIVYGVQYGASADYPMARIQRWLDEFANASKGLPIANRITKFMAGFNSTWDKALWSYLHDTLKLYAYESLVAKMDTNLNAEQIIKSKREIAQFVNDTFGGLQWDNLMITPKEVQMMTWVLLSADWTISTTRQALSVTGIGKIHNETAGLRAKLGWKFWIRAGLYFGLGMNVLNALFREWDMRENPQYYEGDKFTLFDKTMWGNSPGQKTYLFAGRYEDGSERYIRWGKQFRDFFELFDNPLGKIGGKAAPIPTLLSEVFTGHTPSGFRIDDIYKQKGLKYALGIAKTASKAFVPLSIRKAMQEDVEWKATDLMMQSTKGMSRYAAIDYFKQSILDEDWQMFEETYFAALRNNLPAFTLVNDALGWISAEEFIELGKTIDDIDDVKAKMSVTGSGIERQRLGKILARLEREKADIQQGSKLLNGALEKAKSHSIIEGKIQYPQLPTAGIRYRRPEL